MGDIRPTTELAAGDAFRASLLEKVDARLNGCPLWHGWAIMDAFLAGIDWVRGNSTSLPTDAEKLRTALEEIATGSIPDFDPGDDDAVWMLQERARAALSSTGGGE